MRERQLKGVLTELVTPFHEDQSIDYEAIQRLIDFQVAHGKQGYYINRISKDSLSMTAQEQMSFVSAAVKAANGRIPVVANLMCTGKNRALEVLDAFLDSGADYICASQPLLLSYSEEALFDYFAAIIQRSSQPVYIYNMPQAGYRLSPGLIGRLAKEFQDFCGYKDSTQDIIHLQSVVGAVNRDDFSILAGSDATFYPTLAVGGAGIVSLISLVFPDIVKKLYETYQSGDYKAAFAQQLFIMKVRSALKSAPLITGYKTVAKHLGLFETDLGRSPLENTGVDQKQRLFKKLEELGVI